MRYQRKPVVIEAVKMDTLKDESEWPEWLKWAWMKEPGEINSLSGNKRTLHTPDGAVEIQIDDWIIRHADGVLSRCSPEAFEKTYWSGGLDRGQAEDMGRTLHMFELMVQFGLELHKMGSGWIVTHANKVIAEKVQGATPDS